MKNQKKKKEKKDTIVINKKSLWKNLLKIVSVLLILLVVVLIINHFIKKTQEGKLYNIKSEAHLNRVLNKTNPNKNSLRVIAELFGWPKIWYFLDDYYYYGTLDKSTDSMTGGSIAMPTDVPTLSPQISSKEEITLDYSKTNVQIENIDEADVIKTDGEYVYSISDNKVLITEVIDKENPKVLSKIDSASSTYPMDILMNNNKLIIISTSVSSWGYYSNSRTVIDVYDISNRSNPIKVKGLELNSGYNTSRMIDNQVYIFTKSSLNSKDNIKSFREYKEDYKEKEINFSKIKYVKTNPTKEATTFISLDLNSISKDAEISSYLVDLETAYISFDNLYLLKTDYGFWTQNTDIGIYFKKLFGLKGIFGIFDYDYIEYDTWSDSTKISKYSFSDDRTDIIFKEHTKVKGQILNQYSCDEKDGYLRIALNDRQGTRIKVFDSKLKEVGDTGPAAKGEDNKSVRFVGDRAYFVTYKNVDPLFAIDLSDPNNPRIMGELKIPGFSNYLHPYDENHIIGIGMATNEEIVRDVYGRPIREKITFNGMKMTLFDISDIRSPKEKDVAYFGDSRTDSDINKNPKALLFSKEKNLIAIPVSNMGNLMPIQFGGTGYDQEWYRMIKSQIVIHENVKEGYIVFDITTEGFKYKGIISHEKIDSTLNTTYSYDKYYGTSRSPLRGLYINEYLLTVSNTLLKINKLDNLEFISNIDLINNVLKEEIGNTYVSNSIEKTE